MLITSGERPVAVTSYETAIALRRMAMLQPYLPKYLLAPEVAVLLHYLPDERQRMLYATLWNTGARITEALTLTPEDLLLEGPRPCIRLRTLKQRQRGRGRPSADEKIARIVPLLDAGYVDQLRRFLATFRPGRRRPLFDVSRKTAWLWLQQAVERARGGRDRICAAGHQPQDTPAQLCDAPVLQPCTAKSGADLHGP